MLLSITKIKYLGVVLDLNFPLRVHVEDKIKHGVTKLFMSANITSIWMLIGKFADKPTRDQSV